MNVHLHSMREYSYPRWLDNRIAHRLWRKLFCRIGWHLWDETASLDSHSLYCDACGEDVPLNSALIIIENAQRAAEEVTK